MGVHLVDWFAEDYFQHVGPQAWVYQCRENTQHFTCGLGCNIAEEKSQPESAWPLVWHCRKRITALYTRTWVLNLLVTLRHGGLVVWFHVSTNIRPCTVIPLQWLGLGCASQNKISARWCSSLTVALQNTNLSTRVQYLLAFVEGTSLHLPSCPTCW